MNEAGTEIRGGETTGRAETSAVLRLAGWVSYVSGGTAAIGLVFLIAMFASFAVGATSQALAVGRINDERQVGLVSTALLVLGVWLVMTGYLGRSIGALPHGVGMGLLAAAYVGYPIWAFWLGRHPLRLADRPSIQTMEGGEAERSA